MKKINLDDLPEWFEHKTRKKVDPLKKEANKKISKCKAIFDELRLECATLEEIPPTISDDLIIKSAKRFSNKVVNSLADLEFPKIVTFDEVENFKLDLEKLLRTIAQYANRWVSKLGRDKAFLKIIRKINYLLKDIQNLYRKLSSFLEKKYRKAKYIENTEELIEKLKELTEDAKLLKGIESEIEIEIEEKELELKRINEKIQILEKDEFITQSNLIDKDLGKLYQKIRNLIGPIRKPLKKFLKVLDNKNFNARPETVSNISAYINDPLESFLSENDDFSHLNSILLDLNDAINENKLKMKTSAEKRIHRKIKKVEKRDLSSIKSEIKQLNNKKQSLLSNPEYKSRIEDLNALKQEKELSMRENEEVKLKLEKNIDDYNRTLTKLQETKTEIENSILEIVNTQIKILL